MNVAERIEHFIQNRPLLDSQVEDWSPEIIDVLDSDSVKSDEVLEVSAKTTITSQPVSGVTPQKKLILKLVNCRFPGCKISSPPGNKPSYRALKKEQRKHRRLHLNLIMNESISRSRSMVNGQFPVQCNHCLASFECIKVLKNHLKDVLNLPDS